MIFYHILPGVLLANVRYKWLTAAGFGSALSAGVTDAGAFYAFLIDASPPTGALEIFAYDVNDETNYSLGHYQQISGTAPSVADIVDGVWDEAITGHLTSGTTGAKLNSAAAAADPWAVTLPGSYTSHEAGGILARLDIDPPDAPVIPVLAPTSADQLIGYLITYDGQGNLEPGVTLAFQILTAPESTGQAYRKHHFHATSGTDSVLQAAFVQGATYRGRRGVDGPWIDFTVPTTPDGNGGFELPSVLGTP